MPASLVASQFATLEPLGPDDAGIALDLGLPVDELVARAYSAVMTAAATPVHRNGKEA
jgi:gluconokinase